MLLGFRPKPGAFWECTLDFAESDYANVSFFDVSSDRIPFHLSLRPDQGALVFNKRTGPEWDEEETFACDLAATGDTVRIEINSDDIAVLLNGVQVMTRPREAADMSIAAFDIHGGIASVRTGGPGLAATPCDGMIASDSPFALSGWAVDTMRSDQALSLRLAETGADVPIVRLPKPELARAAGCVQDDIGFVANLPGNLWRSVKGASQLTLELSANGRVCAAPFVLSREDVLSLVEALTAAQDPISAFELVSSVEHIACTGLHDRLSTPARKVLVEAIHTYNLHDLLEPAVLDFDGEIAAAAERSARAAEPDLCNLETLQKDFASHLRSDPGATPQSVLGAFGPEFGSDLPIDQQRLLVLRLVEPFCEADQVEALLPLADRAGLRDGSVSEAPWERSFRLPFDLLANDAHAVVTFFQWLGQRPTGWLSTAAIGWSVDRIVRESPLFLSNTDREAIARSFVDYVDWSSWNYYGRAHCRHVTSALVTLVGHAHLFSQWFGEWLVDRVVRSHWLSPEFWKAINTLETPIGVLTDRRLRAANIAFETLCEDLDSGAYAEAWTVVPPAIANDSDRAMRDLAAAGWTADQQAQLDLHRTRDLALRRLALPGGAPIAPGAEERVTRAIRNASPELPRGEYLDLQDRTSRAACALLESLIADPARDVSGQISALRPMLHTLSSRRAGFLGIANGLSLVSACLRAGAVDAAESLASLLERLLDAIPEAERDEVSVSPAIRMAAFGLRQTSALLETGSADRIVALFPGALAQTPPVVESVGPPMLTGDPRSAFHDTLVLVFSCRALLDSRVAPLRETWLKDLSEMGVPYLIVVGDGENTVNGDILELDVPDSYEGLPQKVLGAMHWAFENTAFCHFLKIDDDCFLDTGRFFHSQSHRKFAYYGRRLHRTKGQTDRTWHLSRTGSACADTDIDKSPEPSTYAEGGTGYVLNRTIVEILLRNAQTPEGARLILSSIMEDKLTGDLLGLSGILPDNEDFDACVLRKSHKSGQPVSRWENAFLPSLASPAKIAHLDSPALQAHAADMAQRPTLWPRKVWPTYEPARIGWNTNALDLLSSEARLEEVNSHPLVVICCQRNEAEMLPHFLAHYRRLGVSGFLMVDNCSDDGSLEYLLDQPDVALFSADTDYSASAYGVAWQQALMANFRLNRWSLVADADEFLVLPDGAGTLPQFVTETELADHDAVRVFMLDLYPSVPLPEAVFADRNPFDVATHVDREPFLAESTATGPFSNSETWTSSLRHRLLPGSRSELFVAQKFALLRYRPWMHLSEGLHYVAEADVASRDLMFAHFKYHGAFSRRVAAETRRGQHFNNAEEYRRYQNLLSEGRETLFDPEVSVPWRDCKWVRERLD